MQWYKVHALCRARIQSCFLSQGNVGKRGGKCYAKLWETNLFSWVWGSVFLQWLVLRLLSRFLQICSKFPFKSLQTVCPHLNLRYQDWRALSYYKTVVFWNRFLGRTSARSFGASAKYPLAHLLGEHSKFSSSPSLFARSTIKKTNGQM